MLPELPSCAEDPAEPFLALAARTLHRLCRLFAAPLRGLGPRLSESRVAVSPLPGAQHPPASSPQLPTASARMVQRLPSLAGMVQRRWQSRKAGIWSMQARLPGLGRVEWS